MSPRRNPDAPARNQRPTPSRNPVNPRRIKRPQVGPAPDGPAFFAGQQGTRSDPPGTNNQDPPGQQLDDSQSEALATIAQLLSYYGLDSLISWVRDQIVNGSSETQVIQSLRQQDAYKLRFRGLELRRSAGLNAMSEAEYIAYERQAASMMRAAGFPPGFYDSPDDFADLIGKDVSINELQQRLTTYSEAVFQQPVEVRNQLRRLYGVDEGSLAAFFADPDRGWQVIQKQYRASQVAGGAERQQFGPITAEEAERLADLGISGDQAAERFGVLAQSKEITGALAGEDPASAMTRESMFGAVGGESRAQAEFEARRRRRQAAFEGGGSFANSAEGLAVGSNRAGS